MCIILGALVSSVVYYRDNPLGMGGVMAKRYGELVDDLWTGNAKSITPLKFRVSDFINRITMVQLSCVMNRDFPHTVHSESLCPSV